MKTRVQKVLRYVTILLAIGSAYAIWLQLTGIGIPCIFYLVTGWQCPGCGISRMCVALFHLKFREAFGYNPMIMCLAPILLISGGSSLFRYIRFGDRSTTKLQNIILYVAIGLLVAFGVVRNL